MLTLKKRYLALLCALSLLVALTSTTFALTGDATRAADTLSTLGILRSGSENYDENGVVTRVQATALLVRMAGGEAAAKSTPKGTFTDLPTWAAAAIDYATAKGWVSGRTGQEFKPNEAISANEWCAMVLRLLGYSEAKGDFTHDGAAQFAQHIGLTNVTYTTLTRGDLFQIALTALSAPQKDGSGTLLQNLVKGGEVSQATVNALGLQEGALLTARQIADRYTAAVFSLECYIKTDLASSETSDGSASAFFISETGLAVTNYHSIENTSRITATLSTGEQYNVTRVLYYDVGIDVAVIQVAQTSLKGVKAPSFAYLETVSRDTVRNGDVVYTLGDPLGLGLCISSGIVSNRAKEVVGYDLPAIQNTADISMGSSGGALFNEKGQVVGITSGAYVHGNNMYLAVPIDPVLKADLSGKGWTLQEVTNREMGNTAAS